MEWVVDDFTKSELQPSCWIIVLDVKRVPLQGSYSLPTGSALVFYCNGKVYLIMKDGPLTNDQNHPCRVDVLECADERGAAVSYERYEAELLLSEFEHSKKHKLACKPCERYGKNLACPPFSPTFQEYLGKYRRATVICIRLPQGYFKNAVPEDRDKICFRKGRELLSRELLQFRQRGLGIAGSGPCLACEECSAETGNDTCRKPEKQIYSLESLGINVIALAEKYLNINLEWTHNDRSAGFICSIGAVFYMD
jgi:predicted metal-binding protein